ncbi:MAG: type I restriction endonuclease [Bacteroidales bacterium]
MDFKDQLKQLSDRIEKLKAQISTEEATKTSLIMPFIQALGYDIFNPTEVTPEYVADIGTKKGEKVDYAILKDGQPVILIECKHWSENLDLHNSQLLRYFNVTKAKFAILTNGINYRFFTDLEETNKMDEKPFLDLLMTDLRDNQIEELKKFHKSYFDIENIVNTASELKYTNEIKSILKNEFNQPTESFVRFFVSQVYSGKATEKVLARFAELVKRSTQQFLSDSVTDRLNAALIKEKEANQQEIQQQQQQDLAAKEPQIETTIEEMEGFYIVKSILRKKIDGNRITYRDAQSYFAVFLDDNNRKPLCRLYLNGNKKFIATFDQSKNETKSEISTIDDIFNFAETLEKTVDFYVMTK